MIKTIIIFVCAVLVATLLTSIVSSQLILSDVESFGLTVDFSNRLSVTLKDILGLGPALALLIGLSFLVAFIIARYCLKFIGGNKVYWYFAAGFTSFPVTLFLIKYFMGITLLASARTPVGMLLVACCCMAGSWIYVVLTSRIGDSKNAKL